MPQLIKPQEVKVITKEGECQVAISLELNINLNSSGLEVTAQAKERSPIQHGSPEDKTEWAIPDFEASPRLKFGKNE